MVSEADLEKIRLVDQAVKSLSIDDIKLLLNADLIVGKLKSQDNKPGIILNLFQEFNILQTEVLMLRNEVTNLKSDFMQALRALNTLSLPSTPIYSQDLQNLKSKYNIY